MRSLEIALAAAVIAGPAFAQQTSDRITASPALPVQAPSAESKAVPAAAVAALAPGLIVISSDGQTVGKVFEVVRTPQGQVNRVLIDVSDGKQRSVPAANIRFEDGQAKLNLSRAQVIALAVVQP
jgi:hypothetical protein